MSGPINPDVHLNTPALYAGSFVANSVSVGTAATLIVAVPGGYQGGVTVQNTGTATVYVGGSAVTTATGFPVASNTTLTVSGAKGTSRALYGIATAAFTVKYILAE